VTALRRTPTLWVALFRVGLIPVVITTEVLGDSTTTGVPVALLAAAAAWALALLALALVGLAVSGGTPDVVARSADGTEVARVALPASGEMTKRSVVKALWSLRGTLDDARDAATPGVRENLFPGGRVKAFIAEAGAQLDGAPAAG
jgi:hypothetical protein